jgi:hypothetical protein
MFEDREQKKITQSTPGQSLSLIYVSAIFQSNIFREKQRLEREKHKEKIKDWHKSVLTKNPKEKEKY